MSKLDEDRKRLLFDAVINAGFKYYEDLVHLFVGGSELHGAKLLETDDLDLYGVFIEPAEVVLGLAPCEHFVWSTAGNECRNGPDDVDVTLYSLRKWAGLASKGNPTALHYLFAQNLHSGSGVWHCIVEQRPAFVAREQLAQFLGFVDAQLGRLLGTRGRGKKGQRPELENQYGYDVKAGMHAIRLLNEGKELMERGQITLPRPERELLIKVRAGKWSLEELVEAANELIEQCRQAQSRSVLPQEVDRKAVSKLIANVYREHWRRKETA